MAWLRDRLPRFDTVHVWPELRAVRQGTVTRNFGHGTLWFRCLTAPFQDTTMLCNRFKSRFDADRTRNILEQRFQKTSKKMFLPSNKFVFVENIF